MFNVKLLREARRPVNSLVVGFAFAFSIVSGAFTNYWIPAEVAAVVSFIVIGDGYFRHKEKLEGRSSGENE